MLKGIEHLYKKCFLKNIELIGRLLSCHLKVRERRVFEIATFWPPRVAINKEKCHRKGTVISCKEKTEPVRHS